MHRRRRSGRIAMELPVVLLGTDTLGKVFSEETKTVVLSRHGAGIVSQYKFAPDDLLTLRLPGTAKEAEVRLVGLIGGEPGRYVYGLAFVDPNLAFWPMQFPPAQPLDQPAEQLEFRCIPCGHRQNFAQRDIEEDVYNVNGFVLHFCPGCGTTTRWKKAAGESAGQQDEHRPLVAARSPVSFGASPPASSGAIVRKAGTTAALVVAPDSPDLLLPLADVPRVESAPRPLVSASHLSDAAPQILEAPPPPAVDANGRRINRRRHVRVNVNFTACIRHPAYDDEIVECENVSKGGVCFRSRRQYSLGSLIGIAAPYTTGESPFFSPGRIVRVEPLQSGLGFRFGAAYLR